SDHSPEIKDQHLEEIKDQRPEIEMAKKSKEETVPLLPTPSTSSYGSDRKQSDHKKEKKGSSGQIGTTFTHTNRGIFSFASGVDYLLLGLGTLFSILHGAGFPLLSVVLGGMTTVFLRAQNSEWVVGEGGVTPDGMPGITLEEFKEQVTVFCYYYLGLGVAMFIASYVQIACFESFSERIVHKLRQNYLKAILRQQIEWFDLQQTGNLTSRLTDDLERVREGLGDKLSLFVQNVAAFFAGFGVGFMYSWQMTLVMMAFSPLIIASGYFMGKMMASRTQLEQNIYAVAGAIVEETFSSIRTVQSLNGQNREINRFEVALERARSAGLVKYFYMGICVGFSMICMFGSYAIAFWYGSTIVYADPTFDRGLIFTVFFSVMSGSTALGGALPHLGSIAMATGAARSVLKVINQHPVIDPYSDEGIFLENLKGAVSLKDVHFTYPLRKDNPILKGISLECKAGDKIALVGSSGCGKSTIINMLLRFYDPVKGKISIDGVDVKSLNVRHLRDQIGLVSQEPILFDGTLYENISMGSDQATQEGVIRACTMANAMDFIKRLPDGLGTRVGERGVQLSGGQKQRIAIARALVRNPRILLLDEATSALDTEAETIVQAALEQAMAGRTTIIVAHRLSTIRNADQIFVFKEGTIVEKGTHEELINQGGLFKDMVHAQQLRQEEKQKEETEKDMDDIEMDAAAEDDESSMLIRKRSAAKKASLGGRKFTDDGSVVSLVSSVRSMELDMEESKLKPTSLTKIFNYNRGNWHYFFIGTLGSCISGAVTPIFALVYAQIFNVFAEPPEQMKRDALFWSVIFIVLGLVQAFGFFISAQFQGRCGEALTKKLRMNTFVNLLRQDIAFFDDIKHGTGKLCTRFATDAPNVRYVFTRLPNVLSSIVTIVGAIIIGFIYGWQLAAILLILVPLIIGSGYFEMKMQYGKKMRDTELLEEAGKVASQAVEHVRTVQALNRQEKFHFMYCEYLREPYRENLCAAHTYGGVFAFSQSLIFFMYALAFWLGSNFVEGGSMQPTDVYRVFFAIAFCGQMVGNISSFIPDVVKSRLAGSLMFHLIEHETEIDSLSEDGIKKDLTGEISLRNLHFTYPTRRNLKVLRGMTLDIKPGQTVALVGHSGCGKSTVMGLLERFYNQSRGIILLDNENIRNLNIRALREQVCIVSQEPTLFDDTISENITYGLDRSVTYQEISNAAKMANIHEFILGLPLGYDTQCGEKGTQLSGGQKQRIAIARALVRNPKVLLLDEATSALDTQSEQVVQEALEKARKGRTCLVIAHRLSTIQNSDVIAIVSDGKIVDQGTHDSLLSTSAIYKKLCESQKLVESQ
ncbi:hypothetical protein PENTCL1PPCAC_20522, partial [Pristionchus entomophagus]